MTILPTFVGDMTNDTPYRQATSTNQPTRGGAVPPTIASLRPAPRDLAELPLVLRVEDVALALRVDKSSVYRLARSGQLPSLRLGRSLRFTRDGLRAFLAGESDDAD
jgi:excisionase family DNA binding protein